jgi:hypothetical protein
VSKFQDIKSGAPRADIATWAFELAARAVEDWPEARRRLKKAREYVIAQRRGRASNASDEDIAFAAAFLARVLEADLGLCMTEIVMVLDELGLPTEAVPMVPRRPSGLVGIPKVVPLVRPQAMATEDEPTPPAGTAVQIRKAA